ncbi:YolD-like family protein [Paenibacillus sp. FA6]|uniref:YolD-like family protein n=1 Tax=Paenibacillus sp. FA6 TaxID=3413029 RepID=UPI003F6562C3
MMPEYKEMLQQGVSEQVDIKQPVLEDDRLEELNTILMCSWNDHRPIQVDYYNNKRFNNICGTVKQQI